MFLNPILLQIYSWIQLKMIHMGSRSEGRSWLLPFLISFMCVFLLWSFASTCLSALSPTLRSSWVVDPTWCPLTEWFISWIFLPALTSGMETWADWLKNGSCLNRHLGCFRSKLQFYRRGNILNPGGDCMAAVQALDMPARVVTAEKQTLITNVRQKLHSEESYEMKALI